MRIGMQRRGEQVLDAGFLDFSAGIHDYDPLHGFRDHAQIVGDQDYRRTELLLQADDQVQYLRLDGDVERGGRLVGDKYLGIV